MSLEIIKDVEVGKFYNVPCVQAWWSKSHWLSILPHRHKDLDFQTDNSVIPHYHFDCRFFSFNDFENFTHYVYEESRLGHIAVDTYGDLLIKVKRKLCYRLETGMMPTTRLNKPSIEWYQKMKSASCKGRLCPHYQTPMFERNGQLECPFHGLIGDINKEIIITNIHGV